MQIDQRGLEFIAGFEGDILHLYNDPTGNATIGIGHLVHMGPIDGSPSEAPFRNGLSMQASLDLFKHDLVSYEAAVAGQVHSPLTQDEFDALVSLAYNVGAYGWGGVVNLLNQGNYQGAADLMLAYDHAGGQVLAGLARRRAAERALFLTPDGPATTAPTETEISMELNPRPADYGAWIWKATWAVLYDTPTTDGYKAALAHLQGGGSAGQLLVAMMQSPRGKAVASYRRNLIPGPRRP